MAIYICFRFSISKYSTLKYCDSGNSGNMTIQSIKARQIFDSRGNPTVEVRLYQI